MKENTKTYRRNLNQIQGFTLVELLVTVAIVGILAAISASNLTIFKVKAYDAERFSHLRAIQTAWHGRDSSVDLGLYDRSSGSYESFYKSGCSDTYVQFGGSAKADADDMLAAVPKRWYFATNLNQNARFLSSTQKMTVWKHISLYDCRTAGYSQEIGDEHNRRIMHGPYTPYMAGRCTSPCGKTTLVGKTTHYFNQQSYHDS